MPTWLLPGQRGPALSTPSACLYFFSGHGLVPVVVRLVTWRWWAGQRWGEVPAHCAIVISTPGQDSVEYESIITGTRKSINFRLSGVVYSRLVDIPRIADTIEWLDSQVGRPYGFLPAILTGIGALRPGYAIYCGRVWEWLRGGRGGRTAPLNCSLLCQYALLAGGVEVGGHPTGLPLSPNELMRSFQK